MRQLFVMFFLFVIALTFRLWLTSLVPQPFVYDQLEYEKYAIKIYSAPYMLASHSFRSYPLPLLAAVTYTFTGLGNHAAVFVLQAIIDSITTIMLFWIILRTTGNQKAGYIASLLYGLNPFTSGFTGVLASEVLTIFFITAALAAGILFVKKPTLLSGFLVGCCAGMASQTRNAITIGSAVVIATLVFFVPLLRQKRAYLGVALGLMLTVVYPLYTNWHSYGEITPFKVDSFYAMEFYNGATLKILPPFALPWDYPPDQQIMWKEYWSEDHPERTTRQRHALAQKYIQKAWNVIQTDPWDYVRWRFFKMWYVWQKENIYPIIEPGYQTHRPFIYWGNTILLAGAGVGIVGGYVKKKNKRAGWLWFTMTGMIIAQTLAFSFSHAESRLTLPLYPLVILLVALGLTGWKQTS